MTTRPSIVFVPGAWHGPGTWSKLTSILEPQGFTCVCPTLPSTTGDPSKGFGDDVEAVRTAITSQTTQGHDVVVVSHSYGGWVGPSAAKGLTKPKSSGSVAKEGGGHVVGLVLVATGFVQTGLSFIEAAGGKPPPIWRPDDETGMIVLTADPRMLFYDDLPENEGNEWVSKLEKQSIKSLYEGGEHAYATWMQVPSWYLITAEDKSLPPEAQRMMFQMVRQSGAHVTMREISSSHSPMLSKPKETADFIAEAATAFQA